MNVLHVCNHFWPSTGGIENMVLNLCLESQKRGISPSVLCLNRQHGNKIRLPLREHAQGIWIMRIPFLDFHYYKPAWIPISELKKADVIHVHGVSALSDFVLLTKSFHQKPVVVSTHGGLFHTTALARIKKLYFFGLQKMMLRKADAVVAVSANDKELFSKISKRVRLIENAVNVERFAKTNLSEKKKNAFLFVGRLSENKQIERLLQSFGIAKQAGTNFTLRIAGPDWQNLKEKLQNLAKKLGIEKNVVFLGEISQEALETEYQKAAFFVSASRYEAFGISAIEAMAAGCIPVLQDNDSFRNFVRHGQNGWLTDFSDFKKAGELLARAKFDLRVAKAAQKSAERFSWKNKMDQWAALYEELAGRK